jgi:hypothetical protein
MTAKTKHTQARQAAGTEGGGARGLTPSVVPDMSGVLVAVMAPSSFDSVGDATLDADGGASGEKDAIIGVCKSKVWRKKQQI